MQSRRRTKGKPAAGIFFFLVKPGSSPCILCQKACVTGEGKEILRISYGAVKLTVRRMGNGMLAKPVR